MQLLRRRGACFIDEIKSDAGAAARQCRPTSGLVLQGFWNVSTGC